MPNYLFDLDLDEFEMYDSDVEYEDSYDFYDSEFDRKTYIEEYYAKYYVED
jgi:hypothetical protein